MKKQNIIAAAALTAALISGMAATAFAAEADGAAEAVKPRIYTGFRWEHERDEEKNRYTAESIIPQAVLSEESEAAYPELAKAFSEMNEEQSKISKETYQSILESAKDRLEEDPDYDTTFTDTGTYYVVRSDSNIVSILNLTTGYTGGAHGYEVYSAVNFDTANGQKLVLSDAVKDEEAFRTLVKEQVYSEYPEVEKDLTEQYFEETPLNDMVWTAGYEGVTCYFNEYTLGAYAIGAQTVLIPYEGNDSLFADDIAQVPENYGMEFPLNHPVKVGGREIAVYGTRSEYDNYDSITIELDGQQTEFDKDINTYSIHPTYFKTNGEEYLYLEYRIDDDYRGFDIYHLADVPERCGLVDLGRATLYMEQTGLTTTAAMTDPEDLLLTKDSDLLGTTGIRRTYRIGSDGMPEATEPWFEILGERFLTTKTELNCDEADEEGNVIGNITVPAGTQLKMVRTDGESIVDLELQDGGRIARVEVNKESWPQTIDGIDIEEIFDGIMFVG